METAGCEGRLRPPSLPRVVVQAEERRTAPRERRQHGPSSDQNTPDLSDLDGQIRSFLQGGLLELVGEGPEGPQSLQVARYKAVDLIAVFPRCQTLVHPGEHGGRRN